MTTTTTNKLGCILALTLGALATGCGNTGLGSAVRDDVSARMETTRPSIAACYETALTTNRKLRGTIELSITAEAKTGKFTQVKVVKSDLPDPTLEQCVLAEVGKLALAKPTKSRVAIKYPLSFVPEDLAGGQNAPK